MTCGTISSWRDCGGWLQSSENTCLSLNRDTSYQQMIWNWRPNHGMCHLISTTVTCCDNNSHPILPVTILTYTPMSGSEPHSLPGDIDYCAWSILRPCPSMSLGECNISQANPVHTEAYAPPSYATAHIILINPLTLVSQQKPEGLLNLRREWWDGM